MAIAKVPFIYFNSSSQPITGALIQYKAVGGSVVLYTFVEAGVNFPGYYYVIAATGLYDMYINGVFQTALSPRLHIDSDVLPVLANSDTNLFGDGSDGNITMDGAQGTVTTNGITVFTKDSSTQYTLGRDVYFNNFTLANGITLISNGYRIFAKTSATINGTISNIGPNGGNGGNAAALVQGSGGVAGGTAKGGYLATPQAGRNGGAGGPTQNSGSNGAAGTGTLAAISLGQAGRAGGNGGNSSQTSRPGGSGGGQGGSLLPFTTGGVRHLIASLENRAFGPSSVVAPVLFTSGGGSGGGGAAASGATAGAGGGGGASGSDGGIIVVAASLLQGNGTISAIGGNGGNGGNGAAATAGNDCGGGGGGAGNGGNGGWLVMVYNTKTFSGTATVAGGNAGNPGSGGAGFGTGLAGTSGQTGLPGLTGVLSEFSV